MKTIATFSKPEEAHFLRTRLEAVGIPACIQDEHLVQMDWLFSNAIGGVRVQVSEEDFEEARSFLAADTPEVVDVASEVSCPACGSSQTAVDEMPRKIAYVTLLFLGIPLLFTKRRWRCGSCNHVWKP